MSDRRAFRWLNTLCALVALGAVVAIGAVLLLKSRASAPAPLPPKLSALRDLRRGAVEAENRKDFKQAEALYLAAVNLAPTSPNLHLDVAKFYFTRRQKRKAWEHYRLVVAPTLETDRLPLGGRVTLARYGDLCLALGLTSDARTAYLKCVSDSDWGPKERIRAPMNVLRSRAYIGVANGSSAGFVAFLPPPIKETPRQIEQMTYLRRAVALDPTSAYARCRLAWTLFAMGHRKDAKSQLAIAERCVRNGDAVRLATIADLHWRLGDKARARRTIKKAAQRASGRDATTVAEYAKPITG